MSYDKNEMAHPEREGWTKTVEWQEGWMKLARWNKKNCSIVARFDEETKMWYGAFCACD